MAARDDRGTITISKLLASVASSSTASRTTRSSKTTRRYASSRCARAGCVWRSSARYCTRTAISRRPGGRMRCRCATRSRLGEAWRSGHGSSTAAVGSRGVRARARSRSSAASEAGTAVTSCGGFVASCVCWSEASDCAAAAAIPTTSLSVTRSTSGASSRSSRMSSYDCRRR